ncbi:hypothetical protein pah_c022o017 [Parachlamydia acanthamoebae str. Hall's coccus]|nr:hypothetical protein pah_c022o017 [Parachlamydia acanthamoebae str. Hall's coccus]
MRKTKEICIFGFVQISASYRSNDTIYGVARISMNKKNFKPLQLIQQFPLKNDVLNQKLEQYVASEMERTQNDKKEQHSNIGGWQSKRDLHAHLADDSSKGLLLELFQSFSAPMSQYISSCSELFNVQSNENYDWNYTGAWFNVAVRGGYNAPHVHPLSQISAAYYIYTEEPSSEYPFSGRIDFIIDNITYHFFPKPGTLILFPSDTLHFVHPYYGSTPRISLSFNVNNVHTVHLLPT